MPNKGIQWIARGMRPLMPGVGQTKNMCVLTASGSLFDVDRFVEKTSLPVSRVYRRGEARRSRSKARGPKHTASGFTVPVSDAPWSRLVSQIADAERFLSKHRCEIARLSRIRGLDNLVLDFPIYLRIGKKSGRSVIAAQSDRFPASLVRAAGALRVGLELTIYG